MKRTAAALLALLAGLPAGRAPAQETAPPAAPWWSRNTVCYEVFVRSFQDSDGDGTGDLGGLIQRLD